MPLPICHAAQPSRRLVGIGLVSYLTTVQRSRIEREVAQRMVQISKAWRQLANLALVEQRVSNTTGWCLIYLDRLGPDVRQIDLAREIDISQPSLVRALDQLETAGLVERVPHPEDRRSNQLALTEAGKALVGEIEAKLRTLRGILLEGASDADIDATLRVLRTVGDHIAAERA